MGSELASESTKRAITEHVLVWRVAAAASNRFTSDQLDELEDHVRGGAIELAAGNLRPDECVWLAARRLGAIDELEREYARSRPIASFAASPLALMLLGGALTLVLGRLVSTASGVLFTVAHPDGVSSPAGYATVFAPYAIAFTALWVWVRRSSRRRESVAWLDGSPTRALAVLGAAIAVTFALSTGLALWSSHLSGAMHGLLSSSSPWSTLVLSIALQFMLPVALAALAYGARRRTPAEVA